jgi:hypothetical protein
MAAIRPHLEHDPEKACPGLDPGWHPVFGQDHAPTKYLDAETDSVELDTV